MAGRITLYLGDITADAEAEAIVNAANSSPDKVQEHTVPEPRWPLPVPTAVRPTQSWGA